MAIESPAPAATPPGRLTGIIDSDVHPNFNNGLKDLHEYFPKAWQEKLGTGDVGGGWKSRFAAASYVLPLDYLYINVVGAYRKDSDGEGMAPGTDAAFTAKQLLDPHGIEKGVLMAGHLLGIGAFPDPEVAAAVASAYNDYMCERWIQVDDRFRGAMVVAPQAPDLAVKEIERVQGRHGIVSISSRSTTSSPASATTTRSTRRRSATACRSRRTRAARRTCSLARPRWLGRRPTTSSGTRASRRSTRATC